MKQSNLMSTQPIAPGYKFSTSGVEGRNFKVLERIKLLPYSEKNGYAVVPSKTGNIFRVVSALSSKPKFELREELSVKIGIYGGVEFLKL